MGDKVATSPGHRPRLSPKSPNIDRADYFTPSAERPPPAWSPFGSIDAAHSRADENCLSRGVVATAGRVSAASSHHDERTTARSAGASAAAGAVSSAGAGAVAAAHGWGASAAPSSALSPSSTAFNAKFAQALRRSPAGGAPGTPMHAPAASPFFPPSATPAPAADPSSLSASASPFPSAHPVPPTPGPSTTTGIRFPSASSFAFPTSLPAIRSVTGRPGPLVSRSSTVSTPAANSSRYTLYNPQTLLSVILATVQLGQPPDPPPVLLLDIRTHTAHVAEHLTGSINICVPSTLLRRPAFGIDRVCEGLPRDDQAVFDQWAAAGAIVVIDAESTSLVEGGGVASLLAKFDKAGFAGKLGWVKGGWYALRTQLRALPAHEQQLLLDTGLADGDGSATADGTSTPASPGFKTTGLGGPRSSSPAVSGAGSKKHGRPVLQVRDLPIAAFQLASTSAYLHEAGRGSALSGQGGSNAGGGLPTSRRGVEVTLTSPSTTGGSVSSLASQRPGMDKRRKSGNEPGGSSNRFFASTTPIKPTPDLSATLGLAKANPDNRRLLTGRDQLRTSANPFFDNIRQNSEALSLERSLAHLSPVQLPTIPPAVIPSLPSYLQSLVSLSPMSRADRLARQFYELEAAERERLEGTFRYHAQQTALAGAGKPAVEVADGGNNMAAHEDEDDSAKRWEKFGISAGVELGNLNRFKNIFPYEHSRVRLTQHSPSATDYVNASHLFLNGSSKRFIASQGPLPTTFRDFWQMCEQESVGVIIMLTNLLEGGREKCGRYWISQRDGEWDVHVEGDRAHEEEERVRQKVEAANAASAGPGGGFFNAFDAQPDDKVESAVKDTTIRRTITVQRRPRGPAVPPSRPRTIRHIQYRAWPDFDIPAEPADVVSLVDEVDAAQRDYMREIGWDPAEHGGLEPPILAHCSAGVGRTGVFIMVSSLLDHLRRVRRAHLAASAGGDSMEIDGSSQPEQQRPPLLERTPSDPETSHLSAGLSLSSLSGPPRSPTTPTPTATATATPRATTASQADHPALPPLDVPALEQANPVFAGVNELREQRMSMVANFRQYVCVYECILEGAMRQLNEETAPSA
ncbi:hypothetical protein JCM3770_005867 [Rhodotorula araucariae]